MAIALRVPDVGVLRPSTRSLPETCTSLTPLDPYPFTTDDDRRSDPEVLPEPSPRGRSTFGFPVSHPPTLTVVRDEYVLFRDTGVGTEGGTVCVRKPRGPSSLVSAWSGGTGEPGSLRVLVVVGEEIRLNPTPKGSLDKGLVLNHCDSPKPPGRDWKIEENVTGAGPGRGPTLTAHTGPRPGPVGPAVPPGDRPSASRVSKEDADTRILYYDYWCADRTGTPTPTRIRPRDHAAPERVLWTPYSTRVPREGYTLKECNTRYCIK